MAPRKPYGPYKPKSKRIVVPKIDYPEAAPYERIDAAGLKKAFEDARGGPMGNSNDLYAGFQKYKDAKANKAVGNGAPRKKSRK
jgi:hypothetical protein